jgi:protein-tyrosine kinase
MDQIRKAIERAKGSFDSDLSDHARAQQPQFGPAATPIFAREVSLNSAYLESQRIIAHDVRDPRSRAFDMLRTQILQSMDLKSWQFLGITSPTEGCGKSVVAINLALSIARQPDRSVLLVDLDLQKPRVANYLGFRSDRGVLNVLAGRTSLQDTLIQATIMGEQLMVLPCEGPTLNSSSWIASRPMSALLQDIKQNFWNWTVIFDLPPILLGDDVISILPRLDCVAFVVGAGLTTAEEIRECNKHLDSTEIVRVVLNKSEDTIANDYYYSYARPTNGQAAAKKPSRAPRSKRMSQLFKRLGDADFKIK